MAKDSRDSSYRYVRVDEFTPNGGGPWKSFGDVAAVVQDPGNGPAFTFTGVSPMNNVGAPVARLYLLGPATFRVRFDPKARSARSYDQDGSYAVVNANVGPTNFAILSNNADVLSIKLSADVRLEVLLKPFTVQVFLKNELISTDADQGLVYLPGVAEASAIANFKRYPANAHYFGFGEKGGDTLAMNQQSMTFFNYDNYQYSGPANAYPGSNELPVVPSFSTPGSLNTAEPLYNTIPLLIEDNPNPLRDDGSSTGVPYAYGLFLDNESQTYFNIGQSSSYAGDMYGKYYFGALYGEIDYYFLVGNDVGEVLDQYTTLTGRASLAPMWALGYHQGCYGYFSEAKVVAAGQSHRLARIPLDGMHIDVDFQDNYRTFTASPEKFPNGGKSAFDALHAMGIKASTNITGIVSMVPEDETGQVAPYGVLSAGLTQNAFYMDVRVDEPRPQQPAPLVVNEAYGVDTGVNPYQPLGSTLSTYGHYADLGQIPFRAWWGTLYKPLLDAGLDMVWQDMTDPATQRSVSDSMPWKTLPLNLEVYDFTTGGQVSHAEVHNVFALNLISATYEGLVALRKQSNVDKRPFIIARGGYAGVQRYAASWTGDSASTWDFLRILIPEVLNFGLSGQPLAGADVGGFATAAGGDPQGATGPWGVTDPELLVRWTTLSAFLGWFRNHYDGYNKAFQEPYKYGDPYTSICRRYVEIRYKLLQYFYDALYQCTQDGMPICRPMTLTDRQDLGVYDTPHLNDQFLVGQDILIAPVVTRGQVSRDVYLPAGSDWFAYTDNLAPLQGPSRGGQLINWYVPLDLVPIYVRAGAIIPHREIEQYVGELPVNPLTFDMYPAADGSHLVYLDDHVSTRAQAAAEYRLILLSQSAGTSPNGSRIRSLKIDRLHDGFTPAEPYFFVAMLKSGPPAAVSVNGVAVAIIAVGSDAASGQAMNGSAVDAAYYNASLNTTFVKVFDAAANAIVEGSF